MLVGRTSWGTALLLVAACNGQNPSTTTDMTNADPAPTSGAVSATDDPEPSSEDDPVAVKPPSADGPPAAGAPGDAKARDGGAVGGRAAEPRGNGGGGHGGGSGNGGRSEAGGGGAAGVVSGGPGIAASGTDAGATEPCGDDSPTCAIDVCAMLDEAACRDAAECASIEDSSEYYRGCRNANAQCEQEPTCAVVVDIYPEWAWFPSDCLPERWVAAPTAECATCANLTLQCEDTPGCTEIVDVSGSQHGCRDESLPCAIVETCAQGPEYDLALFPTSCIPQSWALADACDDIPAPQ